MSSLHWPASSFDSLALAMDSVNGTFLDHVVTRANLRRSLRRVVANAGAPGVDGMSVRQLAADQPSHEEDLRQQLAGDTYVPSPIRKCTVPKPGGRGVRVLGIPTVRDRAVQFALAQPLSALLDPAFSPFSYGFRPGRSAHDALRQAAQFVESGLTWVLHLDLEKFFDRAPHDLVLGRLAALLNDPRLLALVQRFLSAPFASGRRLEPRTSGLPQGGPLSPLLANLLLDHLDQRLFDAGFSFCRYADDICIYCESARDAREALAMITPWIEADLKLRLNREKTRIVRAWQDDFLGYRLRVHCGRVGFAPAPMSCVRIRLAVRRLLARRHDLGHVSCRAIAATGKVRLTVLPESPEPPVRFAGPALADDCEASIRECNLYEWPLRPARDE